MITVEELAWLMQEDPGPGAIEHTPPAPVMPPPVRPGQLDEIRVTTVARRTTPAPADFPQFGPAHGAGLFETSGLPGVNVQVWQRTRNPRAGGTWVMPPADARALADQLCRCADAADARMAEQGAPT